MFGVIPMEKIKYCKLAELMVPGPEIFYMHEFEAWMPIAFNIFYIRHNGLNILINSGLPNDTSILERFWLERDKRAKLHKFASVDQALALFGLQPDSIDYILITPLVAYSTGNIGMFNRSKVVIYREGLIDFIAPSVKRGSFSALPDDIVFPGNTLCWLMSQRQNLLLVEDGTTISESDVVSFGTDGMLGSFTS